ncbi:hypothetical protein V2J09_009131 [Rumex salicifolius]
MAFKKTMIQRLFSIARCPSPAPSLKPPLIQSLIHSDPAKRSVDPDPGDGAGLFQRIVRSQSPGIRSIPTGHDQLIEKLRGLDIAKDRIRLEGLIPPPQTAEKSPEQEKIRLTAKDVNKLLRASQLEALKSHLKSIRKDWVSYSDFVELCNEGCSGDKERGAAMAKLLDDSGAVIVLGNTVCLRPHQVVKAIEGLIPLPLTPHDPRRKELEDMEKQRAEIKREAESLVRRELWLGLGYMLAQTAAFMRLTFWELSWDVMEPICFYVTSAYFMAGYAFFLRTSKEPSFEGFYQSRLQSKMNKLAAAREFDLKRYDELRKACYPHVSNAAHDYNHQQLSCSMMNATSFAR